MRNVASYETNRGVTLTAIFLVENADESAPMIRKEMTASVTFSVHFSNGASTDEASQITDFSRAAIVRVAQKKSPPSFYFFT